jgi:hypothetical protein
MNLSPLRSTLTRLSSPYTRQTETNPILPYARQVLEKDRGEQKKFQPLKMVLDLLQRGQYLTANIADEVEESFRTGRPLGESTVEVIRAAFQGLTGQRKGDWETLLFGGNIEGTSDQAGERPGWIPGEWGDEPLLHWKNAQEGATGLGEGILRPRKLIGMAANIALDPTTYIGLGPTKAAKATAGQFAKDTLKLTLATMGADDFAKLGLKFSERAGKNIDDVAKIISKSSIGKRFMEETYNKAFKTALRNSGADLMKEVAPRLQEAGTKTMEIPGLTDLLSRMYKGYEKGGERAFRLGGKELGANVRQPMAPIRAWDTLKTRLETTKPGAFLKDAWWSVMNNSPIGSLKQAIGIRNPYEQLVHLTKRRISDVGIHTVATEEGAKFNQLFKGLDEESKDRALKIMVSAEGGSAPVAERILDPAFQQLNEIKPEEIDKFRGLFEKLKTVSDEWFQKEKEAASIAGLPFDTEPKIVYFPQKQGTGAMSGSQVGRAGPEGTGATGFTKQKSMSVDQKIKNNAAVFDYLMHDKLLSAYQNSGTAITYQEFLEDWVRKNELTESAIDLQTAFTLRGMDHAKAMAKYNMVDEFRQFGIPIADAIAAEPRLGDSLMTWGEGTSKLGLYKVNVDGFKDYLFDEEVAKALTNASTLLRGDAATDEFAKAFGWMTQWWKGTVLMTPGYHVRNWISNNVTGFLKFGPRWMNEAKYFGPSYAGTMYAMHPENYMDLITKELAVKPGMIQKWLNTPVGDFTVREYADYFRSSGLIGSRTQAAGEIGQKFKGNLMEKFSAKNFKPFQWSQKLGDVVENTAKFKSVLLDMEDMTGKGIAQGMDLAERLATNKQYLEYADQEAKKWFIDYSDLTDFEKKTLGKVIPFYSWLRHNVANQLSGLALYPEMYSIIPKVRGAMTSDEDFDYSIMPEYMKNQGYYPVGQTKPGNNIMRWANIPLEDLNKIPVLFEEGNIFKPRFSGREIIDDIMAAAHPLIKSAVEMGTGYDVFHKREIRPFERASPVFQYLNNSPNVVKFLDGAMRLAGFDDGIKINVSRDGKEVQINGKLERFLETNLPALRTLDILLGGSEVVAERLDERVEGWIERTLGKKDYYKGLEELFQITSPMLGVKFKEFNEDQQRIVKEAQLYSEAQKLKARDTTPTRAQETRAAKARVSRETRNRRLFR